MTGINKVIIVGRLGGDPDSRSFPDGDMITSVSIATSECGIEDKVLDYIEGALLR